VVRAGLTLTPLGTMEGGEHLTPLLIVARSALLQMGCAAGYRLLLTPFWPSVNTVLFWYMDRAWNRNDRYASGLPAGGWAEGVSGGGWAEGVSGGYRSEMPATSATPHTASS
jgi:hypothetical protein